MTWSDCKLRIRALLFRRRVEDELDEELKFHLAMQTRRNLDSGMNPRDASLELHESTLAVSSK
jgi:hypothetical protein